MIAFATQGFTMKTQRVRLETSFEEHIVTPGGTRNNGLKNRWVEPFADGLDITSGNGIPSHKVRIGIVITLGRNAKTNTYGAHGAVCSFFQSQGG